MRTCPAPVHRISASMSPAAAKAKVNAADADTAAAKESRPTAGAPRGKAKATAASETADAGKTAQAGRPPRGLPSIKVGPKGVYTEDSIRVYLQEIGRIRLLRPDEEIELARKIADLLHLEEVAAQFETDHGRLPDTKE